MVHYHCRHCETEVGSLPFESAKEALALIEKLDENVSGEEFLTYQKDGTVIVRCICEQCEKALQQFPDYYTLKKWLQ